MAEHAGIDCREMVDMGAVGIGERIERQAFCCALKQRRDAGYFAGEEGVPSFEELVIGYLDAEQCAECCKKLGVADLAPLVPLIKFVAPGKSSHEISRLAACVSSPAGDNLAKIDIEHHAAE